MSGYHGKHGRQDKWKETADIRPGKLQQPKRGAIHKRHSGAAQRGHNQPEDGTADIHAGGEIAPQLVQIQRAAPYCAVSGACDRHGACPWHGFGGGWTENSSGAAL